MTDDELAVADEHTVDSIGRQCLSQRIGRLQVRAADALLTMPRPTLLTAYRYGLRGSAVYIYGLQGSTRLRRLYIRSTRLRRLYIYSLQGSYAYLYGLQGSAFLDGLQGSTRLRRLYMRSTRLRGPCVRSTRLHKAYTAPTKAPVRRDATILFRFVANATAASFVQPHGAAASRIATNEML